MFSNRGINNSVRGGGGGNWHDLQHLLIEASTGLEEDYRDNTRFNNARPLFFIDLHFSFKSRNHGEIAMCFV
jgi:hypothetical protein